jgi:hypothetical protein
MRGRMSSPYAPPRSAETPRAAIGQPPLPAPPPVPAVPPMYWRVLQLSSVRPNGWQRAVLVEGVIGIAVVLALADVASAWTIVVLPLVSMGVVKAHDYLAGLLDPSRRTAPPPARAGDYALFAGIPIGILALRFLIHPTGQQGETSGVIVGVLASLGIAILIYRYLVRRGVPRSRAAAIGVVSFVLSPIAGALGAALESRRTAPPSPQPPPPSPPRR